MFDQLKNSPNKKNAPSITFGEKRAAHEPSIGSEEVAATEKLNGRAVSHKKGEKSQPLATSKRESGPIGRGFDWLYQKTSDGLVHALLKAGEKILFNTRDLRNSRKKSQEELEELTQSPEFNLFLGAVSPALVEAIVHGSLNDDDVRLRSFLTTEKVFLVDIVDALLPKLFVNIINNMGAKAAEATETKEPVTIANIISLISGFLGKHFKKIQPQLAQIEAEEDPIKKRDNLRQLFKPMVEELLAIGLPNKERDLPLIPGARGYVWECLKEQILPDALHKIFHMFMDPREHSKLEELRAMKGGDLLACLCDGMGGKMPELGPQILVEKSEGIADRIAAMFPQVEELSTPLQTDLTQQIKSKEMSVNPSNLSDEWKGDCVDLNSWLEDQIRLVGENKDPAMSDLWMFIGEGIKPIFAHLFLNLAKGTTGDDVFYVVVNKLMLALNQFLEENGEEISVVYQRLKGEGKTNLLEDRELIKLFQPLAKRIIQEAGLDNENDRPTPGILGKKFWNDFESCYLPQLFVRIYVNTSSWQHRVEEYREQIVEITHTNHIPESCQVLARWVSDLLPSYLASGHTALAQDIYGIVRAFLKTEGSDNKSVDKFLQENEETIKQMLSQNIFNIARETLSDKSPAISSATNYLEAVFAKFFNSLTQRVHSKEDSNGEHYQEEFLAKTTLSILDIINKHFSKMNAVKHQQGKSTAHRIDPEAMLKGYGDDLHHAIPKELSKERKIIKEAQKVIDAERKKISKTTRRDRIETSRKKVKEAQALLDKAKEKIDEYRLNHYFRPFIEDLLKTLNLEKPEDLPMSEALWKKFCGEILPKIALDIFDEMAKPYRRNQMLLAAMEGLEASLEKTESLQDDALTGVGASPVSYADQTQKELDLACGELVLQLFQMVPVSVLPEVISRSLFRVAKVKNISGEKIGRALRAKLTNELSAIKILDQGIAAGVTTLYAGYWNEDFPKEERFVPTRDGKEVEGLDQWQSGLPMSEGEKEIQAQQKWEKEQALANQLKKKMVKVPHKAINLSIKDFFVAPWKQFHRSLNRLIRDKLGFAPLIAKQFCDYICHKIFFTLVGGLLAIASYPIRKIVSLITELYLSIKIKHVYNTMQMDIHENLYYKLCDGIKDAIKIHKEDPAKDLITRIVASAVLRPTTA